MKVEHKLTATQQEATRAIATELQRAQSAYYIAIGKAQDHSKIADQAAVALSNILKLIETEASLPPCKTGVYVLSADGTSIVGETADEEQQQQEQASAIALAAKPLRRQDGGLINGSAT